MKREFDNPEFEAFLNGTLVKATLRVGQIVADYLARPFLPAETGKYRQRDSTTAIRDGGWADIKVIEQYGFDRHHTTFVCTGSNVMPSLSDRYSDKPVVWFISRNNETQGAQDCGTFYLIQVSDGITREQWRSTLCQFILTNPDRLQGLPQHILDWFQRGNQT